MHYQKNFLSKVIFRIDFNSVASSLSSSEKPKFTSKIEERFPLSVGRPVSQLSVSLTPDGAGIDQKAVAMQWDHTKVAGGTTLCSLGAEHLSLEYGPGDYTNYNDFIEDVRCVLDAFSNTFDIKCVNRVGLRYINEISIPTGNALDWAGYVRSELISSVIETIPNGCALARSMHQVVAKDDDTFIIMHYGIFNPDYPNQVARREFILDFDCYRESQTATTDLLTVVAGLNKTAESFFEYCIEDELRKEMGANQ